jgi:hypothetical protein
MGSGIKIIPGFPFPAILGLDFLRRSGMLMNDAARTFWFDCRRKFVIANMQVGGAGIIQQ